MDSPPELLVAADGVELRRARTGDAEALAAAVAASQAELRDWMPWAQSDGSFDLDFQRGRLEGDERSWDDGETYQYLAWDGGGVVGAVVLMRRVGPGGIELGYWVRTDRAGRGLATTLAGTAAGAALDLPDVERVEIHCDVANTASARVAAKLGARLDRVVDDEVLAAAETGRLQVWILRR
jgi:RimJ/RimL family protein N-acetyltransferase